MNLKSWVTSLFLLLFLSQVAADLKNDLIGRWISFDVLNSDDNMGIGVGRVLSFEEEGTFSEQIDEGFGIVEE